jgi:competence protein ComEA
MIIVDVAGAVNSPKVVELPPESRVADAIAAAGGLTDKADTVQLNQAAFLIDGEKIYIPEKEENGNGDNGMSGNIKDASKIDDVINLVKSSLL